MPLSLALVAGLAVLGKDGRTAAIVRDEFQSGLIARKRLDRGGGANLARTAVARCAKRGVGQAPQRLSHRGVELAGGDRRVLKGRDERLRQRGANLPGQRELAARREREIVPSGPEPSTPSDGRPARANARVRPRTGLTRLCRPPAGRG